MMLTGCGQPEETPKMLRRIVLSLCLFTAACSRQPNFQVTDLVSSTNTSTYGTTTDYHGSVIARGPSDVDQKTFLVALSVKRTAGGDPSTVQNEPNPSYTVVLVRGGKGHIALSGGYRSSSETWTPAQFEIRVVGYEELHPNGER
jgi:hypothetical protein